MKLGPKSVCAVIPTRGDVEMDEIVEHLYSYPEIAEVKIMVGNTTFNRYLGARDAKQDVILTQDDDCITDMRPVLDAYVPWMIVNAMTRKHAKNYRGRQTLLGFGAIFHKNLLKSIFDKKWKHDDLFYSKADRIFATVNEHWTVFPDIKILPCAEDGNRLFKEPDHGIKVMAINKRIYRVAGIRA